MAAAKSIGENVFSCSAALSIDGTPLKKLDLALVFFRRIVSNLHFQGQTRTSEQAQKFC
jgi:hypothetical protein